MNARLVAWCAVTASVLLGSRAGAAQPAVPPMRELAQDLAAKIAPVVAPLDQVRLARVNFDKEPDEDEAVFLRELSAQLRGRGLSLVTAGETAPLVRLACSRNLRDCVCSAEIVKGDIREIVVASRTNGAQAGGAFEPRIVTLDVRPVLSQRARILDLVEIGGTALVLDIDGFQTYRRTDAGWQPAERAAFPLPVVWPRDARGRLAATGQTVTAFLPGASCTCAVDPLKVDCSASQGAPWPTGVPNSTLAAGANYFSSPGTPPFFSGAEAASRWLLAGVDGKLHVLAAAPGRRQAIAGVGDDIAGLQTPCGTRGPIVAAAPLDGDRRDSLRTYELAGNDLVPLTAEMAMPGTVTALWTITGTASVLAVVQNRDLDRYEAFYVGLACTR